jgi:hypothetical protein
MIIGGGGFCNCAVEFANSLLNLYVLNRGEFPKSVQKTSREAFILNRMIQRFDIYFYCEVDMSQIITLRGAEPRKVLEAFVEKEIPAVMSYLSKGKWHTVKVTPTALGSEKLTVTISPGRKSCPMNIRVDQPVGVSLKYEYGRFIFESKVVGFEMTPASNSGGVLALAMPDRISVLQRRSYYRVEVPNSLKVNVTMWHRCYADGDKQTPISRGGEFAESSRTTPTHYWQGRLADISAGGAAVSIDAEQKPDFKKGQYIVLRFTPMPYETPLMFNAQVRTVLPTADGKCICLGLKIVGLEASAEGREILSRLIEIVQYYYQMNQSPASLQDMQTAGS